MPYNSKKVLRDSAGTAIPQYFNPDTDDFEPMEGADGAARIGLDMENPFGTKFGQLPVSITEGFWSRLARHGRWKQVTVSGQGSFDIPSGGTWQGVTGMDLTVQSGYLFFPRRVILSANIDCELAFKINSSYTVLGYRATATPDGSDNIQGSGYWGAYLKAGTPLVLDFEGEVFVDGDQTNKVAVEARTTTPSGKFTGSIWGYEVTKNA